MADDFSSQLDQAFGGGDAPPLTIRPQGAPAPTADATPQGSDFASQLDAAFPAKSATPPADRGNTDAIVRGLANAIPGMTHIAAAGDTLASYLPRSVGQYLTPNPNDQSGEPISQRFAENLGAERGVDAATYANHPVISTVAPIAGAVAALPVAGPAEAISSGIARVAPGVVADLAGSAAVGAGYGAAYGADSGDTIADSLNAAKMGALVGGVGGAAAPVIGNVLGKVGNAVMTKIGAPEWLGGSAPATVAAQNIQEAIQKDASTGNTALKPPQFAAALQNGQTPVVADLGGETTRALALKAANENPEARGILADTINDRFKNQQPELASWMTSRFGNLDNAETKAQQIADAKGPNTANYKQAYSDGANGVWSPQLANIAQSPYVQQVLPTATDMANDQLARQGLPKIKQPFNVDANGNTQLGTDAAGNQATPTLQYWDQVKRSLDAKITSLKASGQPSLANPVMDAKNDLLSALDDAVPSYATARQGAFDAFGEQNAFKAGQKFANVTDNMGINTLRAAQKQMTPQEQQLFAQGFSGNILQKAMNPSERTNAVRMFTSPAMRDKIDTALGPQMSAELEAHVNRMAGMDQLRTALTGISTTARQHAEMQEGHGILGGIQGTLKNALGQTVGSGVAGGLTGFVGSHELGGELDTSLKAAALGAFAGMVASRVKGMNSAVARATAEQLTSSDPAVVNAAIARTARSPAMMNALRSSTSYLLGSQGTPAALPAPSVRPAAQKQQALPAYAKGGRVRPTAPAISDASRGALALAQRTSP